MPDVKMSGIEFEIRGSARSATDSIERLQASLAKLKSVVSGGTGLTKSAKDIRRFVDAIGKIDTKKLTALGEASNGISKLSKAVTDFSKKAEEVKNTVEHIQKLANIDLSNLTSQIDKIDVEKMQALYNGLRGIATLSANAGNLPAVLDFLKQMSEVDFSNLSQAAGALTALASLKGVVTGGREEDSQTRGLSGFAASVMEMRTIWKDLAAEGEQAVEKMLAPLKTAGATVLQPVIFAFQTLKNAAADAASSFAKVFASGSAAGKPVIGFLGGLGAALLSVAKSALSAAAAIAKVAVGAFLRLASAVKSALKFIGSIPGRIKEAIVNGFNKLKDKVIETGEAIRDWYGKSILMKPFRDAVSSVQGFIHSLENLGRKIKRLVTLRLLRSLIKEVTSAFKEGITNLNAWSHAIGGEFAANMDRMATALLYFKNSLGAMVAPLLNTLAPALDYLIDKVVDLLNVINQLFARLTGATYWTRAIKQAAAYGDAASGAGAAAKEAMKYLAPFDELNVLPSDSGRGGGGGSGGSSGGGMFENVETFDSGIADFADAIRNAWENGDWKSVGETIGNKLNELVDMVEWSKIGEKFGTKINGFFSSEYWTLKNTNFENIGRGIANALNGAIGAIDWSTMGSLVTTKLTVIGDTIIGFFRDFDAKKFGTAVNRFFTGMFNEMTSWISSHNWSELGQKAYIKIKALFDGMDVKTIASSFMNLLGTALGSAASLLGSFIGNIAADIKVWFDNNLRGQTWKETGGNILKWIATGFVNISSWVDTNFITPFVTAIGAESAWTKVKQVGKTILKNIKDGLTNIPGWVSENILTPIMNAFGEDENYTIIDAGKEILANLKVGAADISAWVTNNIINPIGRALAGGHMEYDGYTYDWVSDWTNLDSSAIQSMVESALNFDVGAWVTEHVITPITDNLDAEFWKKIFEPIVAGAIAAIQSALPDWAKRLFGISGAAPTKQYLKEQETQGYVDPTGGFGGGGTGVLNQNLDFLEIPEIEVTATVTSVTSNRLTPKQREINSTANYTSTKRTLNNEQRTIPVWANYSSVKTALTEPQKTIKTWAQYTSTKDGLTEAKKTIKTAAKYTTSQDALSDAKKTLQVLADMRERKVAKQVTEPIATTANIVERTITSKLRDPWNGNRMQIDTSVNVTSVTGLVSKIQSIVSSVFGGGRAMGGAYYGGSWHSIPQYASGGSPHGTIFLAGEAGPEIVGHVGGRTEVLNQSQLAASISAGVARAINSASFQIRGATTMPTYAENEDTEESMYRATMRALQALGLTGEAIQNIRAHISSGEVYASVRESNRQNTRVTGVNALA